MEKHFAEHLDLEQLCGLVHLSKSTLLRAFTRAKGITPYHYLVNLRICAAKRLLEQGALSWKQPCKQAFPIKVISQTVSADILD